MGGSEKRADEMGDAETGKVRAEAQEKGNGSVSPHSNCGECQRIGARRILFTVRRSTLSAIHTLSSACAHNAQTFEDELKHIVNHKPLSAGTRSHLRCMTGTPDVGFDARSRIRSLLQHIAATYIQGHASGYACYNSAKTDLNSAAGAFFARQTTSTRTSAAPAMGLYIDDTPLRQGNHVQDEATKNHSRFCVWIPSAPPRAPLVTTAGMTVSESSFRDPQPSRYHSSEHSCAMHLAQAELEAAVPILVDHLLVHASTDQKSSRMPFFCPLRTAVGQNLSLCTRFISNDDIDTALSRLNCVYESSSGLDEHTETERDRDRDDLANVRATLPPSRSDCFRQVVGGGFRAGPRALPPWV